MKEFIFKLCAAHGASGSEGSVAKLLSDRLKQYADVEIDQNGTLIAQMGNLAAEKHIMLDAHIDQIGLIVTDIDEHGFLKVAACGGIDRRVLPGAVMKVCAKEELLGIVSCLPPHLSKGGEEKIPSIEEFSIDVGLSQKQAETLIERGNRILFAQEPKQLLGNRIAAPALDNRAGAAVLVRCAELLSHKNLSCKLSIVLSVQEETSALGAATASYALNPDEAVVVDVSFASQPSVPSEKSGELSKGPMIGIAPSLSSRVTKTLFTLAEKHGISYQTEVMGGKTGTNADKVSVSRSGIPSGLVSVPERNMHTPVEVVDLEDVETTARLLSLYVENGGGMID